MQRRRRNLTSRTCKVGKKNLQLSHRANAWHSNTVLVLLKSSSLRSSFWLCSLHSMTLALRCFRGQPCFFDCYYYYYYYYYLSDTTEQLLTGSRIEGQPLICRRFEYFIINYRAWFYIIIYIIIIINPTNLMGKKCNKCEPFLFFLLISNLLSRPHGR